MSQIEKILAFWFGAPDSEIYGTNRKIWFSKDPEFDRQLREKFLPEYEQAAAGALENWRSEPLSCLAYILVCDQFPRNMFRDTPRSFATDDQALSAAQSAIAQGFDQQLLPVQRWFMYLPLEHSENPEHQCQVVKLFQDLTQEHPDSQSSYDFALRHQAMIDRFGRFPHRNAILGRDTTPEEAEFLQQPGSSF